MSISSQHEALCETLIGRPCNCPARVLARVSPPQPKVPIEHLALAQALSRVHDLEWKLAEREKDFQTRDQQLTAARLETRRVEEKLAFTQRALDLHTQTCEKKVCNCKEDSAPFMCYVHGKASRKCLCFPGGIPNFICPIHGIEMESRS